MGSLISRIEVLLLTAVIGTGPLFVAAAKPVVDVELSSVDMLDRLVRFETECEAGLQQRAKNPASQQHVVQAYKRRLYSEEAGATPQERWSLGRAISVGFVLELSGMLHEVRLSHNDLWTSDSARFGSCHNLLSELNESIENILVAYHYVGAPNPMSIQLVDLDARFDANVKAPFIDGQFPVRTVQRISVGIIVSATVYAAVLLKSIRRDKKRRSRFEYGALPFLQPGLAAVVLSATWLLIPAGVFSYLVLSGIAAGVEGLCLGVLILISTGWVLREAYLLRVQVLRPFTNVMQRIDVAKTPLPRGGPTP